MRLVPRKLVATAILIPFNEMDADYRVVCRRQAIGFLSCLLIVGVAMAIIIRVAWAPILMGFILVGVTDVKTTAL